MYKTNIYLLLNNIIEKAEALLVNDDIIKSNTVNSTITEDTKTKLDTLKNEIANNSDLLTLFNNSNINNGAQITNYISNIYSYVENLNYIIDNQDFPSFDNIINNIFDIFNNIIEE